MTRTASLAALLLCLTAPPALADYPTRPITLIVPAAAAVSYTHLTLPTNREV